MRRLDGETPRPFVDTPEPTCADCGVTERSGNRKWGDGKVLRKYGDEHACHPCANGERETYGLAWDAYPIEDVGPATGGYVQPIPTDRPWDCADANPVEEFRKQIKQIEDDSGFKR